jgi:hypothetical protein
MKAFNLKVRVIAPLAIICFLAGVTGREARAQRTPPGSGPYPPTSGALLTITGTANGAVSVAIYDSQIHSGTVQPPPLANSETNTSNCNSTDVMYPTDAYVMQGGSWTGCDPGDSFEVTDNNSNGTHQAFGKTDISKFHVETHYLISPGTAIGISQASQSAGITTYCYTLSSGPDLLVGQDILITGMNEAADNGLFVIASVVPGKSFTVANPAGVSSNSEEEGTGTVQLCNTSLTICSNPDSGFMTVTNNTGDAFTGTISLQGTSPLAGGGSCASSVTEGGPGVAFDTWTSGLAPGASVTLALGSPVVSDAVFVDSSNCGGFSAPQTLPIAAGATTIFHVGNDDLQITPANSNPGDTLTLLPVPVPAGPLTGNMFGSEIVDFPNTAAFSAGSTYPTQASIPYSDLSANKNPVGLELQLTCTPAPETTSDCSTFINSNQVDFTVDKNSFPSGIGGVQFLAEHDGNPAGYLGQCPTEGFDVDIIFSYTATTPDPIKGKTGGNSCFVTTFSPTAPPVAAGSTVTSKTFQGFFLPVLDTKLNIVEDGLPVPLSWETFDNITGKPITNLTLCPNSAGTGCTAPWVFIGTFPISCTNTSDIIGPLTPAPGKSIFLNYRTGLYTYALNTLKHSTGCFTPVLTFSTSFVSYGVANFKFI